MQIEAREEIWPLDKPFRISRGTRSEARVVVVTVTDRQHTGRGEAVPISRYNQSAHNSCDVSGNVLATARLMRNNWINL